MTRRKTSRADLFPTLDFEQYLWKGGYAHVAGVDEAGRGAWAGPVASAAVILPCDATIIKKLDGVRDSKLMTPAGRETWAPRIKEAAMAWGVGFASSQEIDTMGIVPATRLAAMRALDAMQPQPCSPDYLLTDYLVFRELALPQTALVKGDQLSLSVAAASVLAKTARDALMRELDDKYPAYGFARHKGYGTLFHRQAIYKAGLCSQHRRSFSIAVP
jgi:ribonuclease HII